MKNNFLKLGRTAIAFAITVCMLVGAFAPCVMAASVHSNAKNLQNNATSKIESEVYEAFDNLLASAEKLDTTLSDAISMIFGLTENVKNKTHALLDSVAQNAGINIYNALSNQIKNIYAQVESGASAEQIAKLNAKTEDLISRLYETAALTTAVDMDVDYYLSLGDSTLSGYGLKEYIQGANNGEGQVLGTEAPVLLAQKLFGDDYKDHFKKLDKGGLRIDDLMVWLGQDEFIDDFYLRYTLKANSAENKTSYYQQLFVSEVEKADLITLAIGGGNVTTFLGQQILAAKNGQPLYEMDWSKYLSESETENLKEFINALAKLLEGKLPEIEGIPVNELAPVIAESFIFGMYGYINNYTKVIDRIHEINPEARIVIINLFNPIETLELPIDVDGTAVMLPAGKMIGAFMDSMNASNISFAIENNDYATCVTINDTTTVLDEQGIFDYQEQLGGMIKETWKTHAGPNGHVYISQQIYNSVTHKYTDEEIALEVLSALADYTAFVVSEFGDKSITDGAVNIYNSASAVYEKTNAFIDRKAEEIQEKISVLKSLINEKKDDACEVISEIKSSLTNLAAYFKK